MGISAYIEGGGETGDVSPMPPLGRTPLEVSPFVGVRFVSDSVGHNLVAFFLLRTEDDLALTTPDENCTMFWGRHYLEIVRDLFYGS